MKKRGIFLAVLLLLCIMTAACAPEVSNDVLDEKFQALQTAFATNDEERAFELLYLENQTETEFHDFFSEVLDYWPVTQDDVYTLTKFHIEKTGYYDQWDGIYSGETAGQPYLVQIVYMESEELTGIVNFRVVLEEEYVAAESAQYAPAGAKHWIMLAWWVICLAFIVFSIIDIIRKKPRRYGLWILLSLVSVGVCYSNGDGFGTVQAIFGLLNQSRYVAFATGGFEIKVTIPIGAILYWCRRKSLLSAKAKREALAENSVSMEESEKYKDASQNKDEE